MTGPRHARQAGGRYYEVAGERYWSVTTILKAVPKDALTYWAAREVATWVADNMGAVTELCRTDRQAAIDTMKGAPWRKSGKARDLGSDIHAVAEAFSLGTPLPVWTDEADPYLRHLMAFFEDFDVEVQMSEATVANHQYRYAGTLDQIALVSGSRLLIDVKTGKGVYPEAALQLAAYRHAESVLMPDGSEVEMPQVDGGAVLHLTPDGYELIPVRCDRPVFDAFLYVREVWRWVEHTSKSVIGEAVRPVQEVASAAP